ncbi:Uncharacterized protein APZ42_022212 [Daphnia magna]|uniref:Uncharacterized protein n=1 Tax=Daphnia magna TaxID=35525 RepID=A0A164W538_9CRUS|nr:Uncharacterized protein APZ42_022212 [Daphnia magna]
MFCTRLALRATPQKRNVTCSSFSLFFFSVSFCYVDSVGALPNLKEKKTGAVRNVLGCNCLSVTIGGEDVEWGGRAKNNRRVCPLSLYIGRQSSLPLCFRPIFFLCPFISFRLFYSMRWPNSFAVSRQMNPRQHHKHPLSFLNIFSCRPRW